MAIKNKREGIFRNANINKVEWVLTITRRATVTRITEAGVGSGTGIVAGRMGRAVRCLEIAVVDGFLLLVGEEMRGKVNKQRRSCQEGNSVTGACLSISRVSFNAAAGVGAWASVGADRGVARGTCVFLILTIVNS